ncbi:MAG: hypothetical protein JJE52_05810 [Acidimicrobiia bacterium]|nr:hypothetical protein [Acidimicrobiia bacterium]
MATRSGSDRGHNPFDEALSPLPRPLRTLAVCVVAAIVVGPALVGLLGVGPVKFKWGMYSDADHVGVSYVAIDHTGEPLDLDLAVLGWWAHGDHITEGPLRELCDAHPAADSVQRLVRGRVVEEHTC